MTRLKAYRQRLVNSLGVRAVHALEDGATLGTLLGLTLTFPPAVAVVCIALFGDGIGPKKILKHADEVVRQDDITAQPTHFVGAFIVSGVIGVGVGALFRVTAAWSGVSIPDVVGILLGV